MTVLLIALGAAVGAPSRYLTDRAVQRWTGNRLPWGTLAVNVVASAVLGYVVGAAAGAQLSAFIGTGFCGALSTYSTFGYETIRLVETRRRTAAVANVAVALIAGIAAAAIGYRLGG